MWADFCTREGNARFRKVQLLTPQLVWDYISGGLKFNTWLGHAAGLDSSIAEARKKIVEDVDNAVKMWVDGGRDSGAFAAAVAEHLQMPNDVMRYLSYRGGFPANAALTVKGFRDEIQVFLKNYGDFGVIRVLRNVSPGEARDENCCLVLRTLPYTECAASPNDWLLGELRFSDSAARDRAEDCVAAAADAVNEFLAQQLRSASWQFVQKYCRDAFINAKTASQKPDGTLDEAAAEQLTALLREALPPGAVDGGAAQTAGGASGAAEAPVF